MRFRNVVSGALLLVAVPGCASKYQFGTGPGEVSFTQVVDVSRGYRVLVRTADGVTSEGRDLLARGDSLFLLKPGYAYAIANVDEIRVRHPLATLLGGAGGLVVGGGIAALATNCGPPACRRFVIGLGGGVGTIVGLLLGPQFGTTWFVKARE